VKTLFKIPTTMGKKNKVNLSVDGIQAKNQTEFIELVRKELDETSFN